MERPVKAGFTLIEILVVIAIIAIIAALLFPVYAKVKQSGVERSCSSQLKQTALAIQLYRTDHDGQGWLNVLDSSGLRTSAGRLKFPWNDWLPLEPYLKEGKLVWCPGHDRSDEFGGVVNLYKYQTMYRPLIFTDGSVSWRALFDAEPTRVVAFCSNHSDREILSALPSTASGRDLRKGRHLAAREDGSTFSVDARQIKLRYLWENLSWHDIPPASGPSTQFFVFPGENWPPQAGWIP